MKRNNRFVFMFVLALASLTLGACGPSLASSSGGGRALAAPVEFTGVIEAIDGNQWTVDGQLVTVDPSTVRDGPFAVGDTVKIKAQVGADGTLTATAVEPPSSANGNSNDGNANEDNSNAASDNSNSGSDNNNDQAGEDQKITGVVEAINGNQITINGVTYTVAAGVDLSGISVGDTVTIEVVTNPDGTQTVTEIKSGDDDNSNDDNSNDDNSNDDNSNDDNSNDNDDDDDNSNGRDDGDDDND